MIPVEYKDEKKNIYLEFEIPEGESEVMLYHYQGYLAVAKKWQLEHKEEEITDIRHVIFIVAALTDRPVEEIEMMDSASFEVLVEKLVPIYRGAFDYEQKVKGQQPKEEVEIEINGNSYKASEDYDQMNVGQWAEIGGLLADMDFQSAFHIVLAILLRKEGDPSILSGKEIAKRAEEFQMNARFHDVNRLLFFYLHGSQKYSPFTAIYMVMTMGLTKGMKVYHKVRSLKESGTQDMGITPPSLHFKKTEHLEQL
jgi:hypothetical protein